MFSNQLGDGETLHKRRLQRPSEPHGEGGELVHAGANVAFVRVSLRTFYCAPLQDGPLVLEPGPLFARDGDKNRSEQINYRILRGQNRLREEWTTEFTANPRFWSLSPPSGNEGNIFQIDEDTGNITMTKAADIAGPITLTVLVNPYLPLDALCRTSGV